MTQGHSIRRAAFLPAFRCLGAECEDTCCHGWSMQVDAATMQRYHAEAPELVDAVTETEVGCVMRRDPQTDYCVKYKNGLCSIHAERGDRFLGDACHFYPRVTRQLEDTTLMTAALSCPEVARLALLGEKGAEIGLVSEIERLPATVKNYQPEALSSEQALAVHRAFLDTAMEEGVSAERVMARVVSVSHSLENLPQASWPEAVPFYLKSADARLPVPEAAPSDAFNLLHALMGLVVASHATNRKRLMQTLAEMEQALQVKLEWEGLGIRALGDTMGVYHQLESAWNEKHAAKMGRFLKRWVQMQLSISLFPFAGFGRNIKERVLLMGVRFATVRLALMCAAQVNGDGFDDGAKVRVVQSIARVLDHLADPELSVTIYTEPGWMREARLLSIVGVK